MSELRLIHGGGEIVGFLEDMLERAREGAIDSIAVAVTQRDQIVGSGLAFRPDAPELFVRTLGAVSLLQHDLLTGRLTFGDEE